MTYEIPRYSKSFVIIFMCRKRAFEKKKSRALCGSNAVKRCSYSILAALNVTLLSLFGLLKVRRALNMRFSYIFQRGTT
jgi:hypothetical protein